MAQWQPQTCIEGGEQIGIHQHSGRVADQWQLHGRSHKHYNKRVVCGRCQLPVHRRKRMTSAHRPRSIRRASALAAFIAISLSGAMAQVESEIVTLVPGKVIEGQMSGRDTAVYNLPLRAN